jgi:hypothetical protein
MKQLTPESRIKVEWSDRPENYSKEAKIKLRNQVAAKYGVSKSNVKVNYTPVRVNENGDLVEINGSGIDNIMDSNYQISLMKEWIKREGVIVDFDRILKLDDKINKELNIVNVETHKKYSLKWLTLNNFLCFGENNFISYNKLKGLTVVNSIPTNTGGKTSFTIDAPLFLYYGNTTKTSKNEEIFNQFSGKDEVVVRGLLEMEDYEEVIIERKLTRKAKKTGGWTVSNKVNYYRIMADGKESMLNDEEAGRTTKRIGEAIGSQEDFEMLVLATESNLDNLIGLTTTESGKVLTRLIGLEVIEKKEAIVRKMFNDFEKKKKSNEFDVVTLGIEIGEHKEKILMCEELLKNARIKLDDTKNEIVGFNNQIEALINSKDRIDVKINALNPSKLEQEIKSITDKGTGIKERISQLNIDLARIGEINFDEFRYVELTKSLTKNTSEKAVLESDIRRLEKQIKDLEDGGICQACMRKLDDVDNSGHIKTHQNTILSLTETLTKTQYNISEIKKELEDLELIKKKIDEKNRKELDRDRLGVEIDSLRNEIGSKKLDLKKYNDSLASIERNKNIEIEVSLVKTNLVVSEHSKDTLISNIERLKNDVIINGESVATKEALIIQIEREESVSKIFKIYIDMIGKKGISKLVLRSILPIINSEVQRLLDEVCEFELEVFIDDKNDVQFLMVKDGVIKNLKSGSGFEKTASSLALRSVLGKLSTLPMPNFISFDEVLGKVANDNLPNLKPLFDKISDMYDIVFLITHNDMVRDWADNIVTLQKEKNITKLLLK